MDTSFCLDALEDALRRGRPEIFNTDQGAQFTSAAFTDKLEATGVRISMDGRGRWLDNVFVELLWRSLKYEEVDLKAYANGLEARSDIGQWFRFYNERRPHQASGYKTPGAAWAAEVSPVDLPLCLDDLARRLQLHRANDSKTWYTSDEEEERPSPYEPTPAALSLGSTAKIRSARHFRDHGAWRKGRRDQRSLLFLAPVALRFDASDHLNPSHPTISCIGANNGACTCARLRQLAKLSGRRPSAEGYSFFSCGSILRKCARISGIIRSRNCCCPSAPQ